jgi:hypothetical protein
MGMNKILKSMIFTGWLLILVTTACNLSASKPTVVVPSPTESATQTAAPLPTAVPTEIVIVATPTSEFAPFCEADSTTTSLLPQCQFPVAEESTTFCTKKDPYNLIFINEGMTYEVIDEGFWCSDAGKKDGRQMVTCTGPMASNFQLNVCDPACVVPTVQAENTKCPQSYNYNSFQGCCSQEIQMLNRNCMVYEFRTTTCQIDCTVYTTETACGKNSYACQWNVQKKFCYARK